MLLTIDIGNTNTTLGVFGAAKGVIDLRLQTDASRPIDEWATLLDSVLSLHAVRFHDVDGVAMASVVPVVGEVLGVVVRKYLRIDPLNVTAGATDLGMPVHYQPPAALGADRFVNAFAARSVYGAPCIIVDYGTATKLEAVSSDGAYRGGAILPGIGIAMEALFARGARLAAIPLDEPPPPPSGIGANTADALRAGILLGAAAQTDGLVARFQSAIGPNAPVIATGGLASRVVPFASSITTTDPLLTLEGLRRAHNRVRGTAY